MSATLVTGATGTVGGAIVARLAEEGATVRALVRSADRARPMLPAGVEPVEGDVTDAAAMRHAVEGCERVFHAAGLPEQWRLDPLDFTRVNVEGTRNLVEAAGAARVERFVYTSTIDVFAWQPGQPFDESVLDPDPRPTHYERSKQEADRVVVEALEAGLPAVFIHPSAVYGPAPVLAAGLNDFLARLAKRQIPMLLPGGMPVVYAADVADGHLRAAERPPGARYILSDAYYSLAEIAQAVRAWEPHAKVPPVMPAAFARMVSVAGERVARVTKKAPLIPRGALHFLQSDPRPDASLAESELGWRATPFEEGLERTLACFRERGWLG